MDALFAERKRTLQNPDSDRADETGSTFLNHGIEVSDTVEGTEWRYLEARATEKDPIMSRDRAHFMAGCCACFEYEDNQINQEMGGTNHG